MQNQEKDKRKLERFEHIGNWRFYAKDAEQFTLGNFFVSVTTALDCVVSSKDKDFLIGIDKSSYDLIMTSTAKTGDLIHSQIQDFALFGNNKESNKYVEIYSELQKKHNFSINECERQVHSEKYGFAGTIDMIGSAKNTPSIFEIKTGKYKITAGWQACAYKYALEEELNSNEDELNNKNYNVVGMQIHRNGTDNDVFFYKQTTECFVAFLSALNTFRMVHYNELKKLNWKYINTNPLTTFYKGINYV